MAQNTEKTSYTNCAEKLSMSIKRVMPDASVSIVTNDRCDWSVFDHTIELPHSDLGGFANDWQVYEASPYDYTIKLEADMYIPRNIDHWWDVLKDRDVVVSSTIRNFKQQISDVRVYRRFIDDNDLPDVYNAITYFKKSDTAQEFFNLVKEIFTNWEEYKKILKCNPDELATTDWVYSLVSHIIGIEKTTLPTFTEMSMVHMKSYVNNTPTENWTDTFVYECLPDQIRIQTIPQVYPLHYHIKNFCDKIII